MLDIYYNSETGVCADLDKAQNALCSAADSFCCLKKVMENIVMHSPDKVLKFSLCRDSNKCIHTIGSCINNLPNEKKQTVKILLEAFGKGQILSEVPNDGTWLLEDLNLPSAILEYALKHNGMMLSITDEVFWQKDFIIFKDQSSKLPNIWGQTNLDEIKKWLTYWRQSNARIEYLLSEFNVKSCYEITENRFSDDAWKEIFACMKKGKEQQFYPDGTLIKSFSINTTKGSILEIRFMDSGLRFFFVYAESIFYLGGVYKKGQGLDKKMQSAAAKQAKQRINSFLSNKSN